MNIDVLYLIIGIIATLITGFWGIRYTSKHKSKMRLIFLEKDCVSLFTSVVREVNDLEIIFKGKPINENLITYKGSIFNAGNLDIDKAIIYEPLRIILPVGFEWRKVKITDKSDKLVINLKETIDGIMFSWDILKKHEYFTFDSVIEYTGEGKKSNKEKIDKEDIGKRLFSGLKITQRITNLDYIRKVKEPQKPKISNLFGSIFMGIVFLIIGYAMSFYEKKFPEQSIYHEVKLDSTYVYYEIDLLRQNEIIFRDSLGKKVFSEKIDNLPSDFFTGKIKTVNGKFKIGQFILGVILIVLSIMMFFVYSDSYFLDKRLYDEIKVLLDK